MMRRQPARQRGKVRIVGTLVVIVLIAALGGLAWYLGHRPAESTAGAGGSGGPGGPPGAGPGGPGAGGAGGGRRGATTVGTAVAASTDIPVILEALGTVTPTATVTVRPQVSGVITEIRFKEGQLVNRNDVLAVIDRRPFEMALLQAQGDLKRDQAELENAKVQVDRYKTLLGQDSIAQQDYDAQVATYKQLVGTVASDQAAVGTAQLQLEYSEIRAPSAGRVGLRVIDAGNYIGAGDTNGIVVITQVSPTDVEFTVPQDRVGEILEPMHQNQTLPVVALDRTRTNTLASGVFSTLDNLVNTQTGTVRAKARFENKDGTLFPSQFVNVRVTLRVIKNAVTLPVSAVRNGPDGDFVWLLTPEKTASMRKVTRGEATNDSVQIVKGVEVGDTVITEGGDRLKDGGPVQLPKPAGAHGGGDAGDNAANGNPPADAAQNPDAKKHHRHKDGDSSSKPDSAPAPAGSP